ncbi:MAG: glycosyltransferase family 2 protein [Aestuariivirga sp.]|uniref:glycosyltransferase family 2 protein n=1 Tax=Aestuariivirga sp. TaxID=2650926 RepID=UPI0038D0E431
MPRTAILICTFDRPELLRSLLAALARDRQPDTRVVVLDNGATPSEHIVTAFRAALDVDYQRLASPGLAAARNACLRAALAQRPEFLAFIDDDELPEPGWLASLLRTLTETGADFATGPVVPRFVDPPPSWITRGRFFEKSGETYCTSNLIIRASALPPDERDWFQPAFNFSGGEDNEFLNRLADNGAAHAVARDAVVIETIPPGRMKRRYVWRGGLRDGVVIAEIAAARRGPGPGCYLFCLWRMTQKLGYAANHLLWAPLAPWRINRAMADAAAAAGILLRASGRRFAFYGPDAKRG